MQYHVPHALDLAGENGRELGEQAASQGLMALPRMAEIYPVGGRWEGQPRDVFMATMATNEGVSSAF